MEKTSVKVVSLMLDNPEWFDEKAIVYPYDPKWEDHARQEQAQLLELLEPWLVDGVEHVGSTAVPGLMTKPIFDFIASVTDMDLVVAQAGIALADAGWCYIPLERDGQEWRRFFIKPDESRKRRFAHLQLVVAGHIRWTNQIAFRNALRENAELAKDYVELKRRLSERYRDDRAAYAEAKSDFIIQVIYRKTR